MSFSLLLLSIFITGVVGVVGWALGYRAGHEDGADDGFDDGFDEGFDEGYDFATGDSEVRWRLTAQGASALDAAREPLAELSLHQSADHTTRTFKKP